MTQTSYIYQYDSPIGILTMASDKKNLTGLWIAEQKYFGRTLSKNLEPAYIPIFKQTSDWLDAYFAGKNPVMDIPVSPQGSPFSKKVWMELLNIPYGTTVTYGSIAKKIVQDPQKAAKSAQAVGLAVGHNPISILIPCHRVIGADGNLTGFAGGLDKKIFLLKLEGIPLQTEKKRRL